MLRGGRDLRQPARLLEVRDDVELAAERAVDVLRVEVRELVAEGHGAERAAQHRVLLPAREQALLLVIGQVGERLARAQHGRAIEQHQAAAPHTRDQGRM
ncbi:MAG: hypothetical protein M5U28_51315 [Sandaracinaceae bacterium]|nr:hypothetical protein [Sandaracinaceae bacterium]